MTLPATARRLVGRVLPLTLKTRLRGMAGTLRWFAFRLWRDPPVELYSRRMDRLNATFFLELREDRRRGRESWLDPYATRQIPRTAWVFWHSGETSFPPVVAECVARLRALNPTWTVRVLDAAEAERLVDMRDVPDGFPRRIYADALRVRLLRQFGGVWLDATVLVHRPLDDWLPLVARTGFFVFTDEGPGREVASWFIASEAGHPLIGAWDDAIRRHLARTTTPHEAYFHTFYVFQHWIRRDPGLRNAFAIMPRLPAPPCFFLAVELAGFASPGSFRDAIRSGLPLSKLDWRMSTSVEDVRAFVDAASAVPNGRA